MASTSFRLEQMITVFVKSTVDTSAFCRRLFNTESTWSSQIPSLTFNNIELRPTSFALTISFNCNILKLNHVCVQHQTKLHVVLPMPYIYRLLWCIFYKVVQYL